MKLIKRLVKNSRHKKLYKKLTTDFNIINAYIEEASELKEPKKHRSFYWNQLIMQEINMYISLGEQVNKEELEMLCDRRGFTAFEKAYLGSLISIVGLGKRL